MSPIGRTLAFLAGLLVVVSAFVPWLDLGSSAEEGAADISSGWTVGFDLDSAASNWAVSLLVPLLVGAALIIVGAIVRSSAITGIAGLGVVLVVVLWELQENRLRGGGSLSVTSTSDVTLDGSLGPGPVLALVGGVLAIVCAVVLRKKRTDVVSSTA